jgi:hypothetical protein
MIGAYILFLFLFILSFGITSVIILSLNTLHSDRRDKGHSTWFLKLVILFMCIASFKITYNIIDKPNTWFCTDEPIATNKNMETYVYYNFFQTDSVVKEVHKFEYIKAIITREKMQDEGDEGISHMHIDVKSADGNYFIKDYCTRFEDLPYNEFKKRIAFRKEYWPDVHYELIYFSN